MAIAFSLTDHRVGPMGYHVEMTPLLRTSIFLSLGSFGFLLGACGGEEESPKGGASDGGGSSDGDGDGDGEEVDLGPPTETASGVVCNPGFTCSDSESSDVVWVMKDEGNVNGPSCQDVCEAALDQNCAYHACEEGHPVPAMDMSGFAPIAESLGFDCREGGCWDSEAPGEGMIMVSIDTAEDGSKSCYFPTEETMSCNANPGNANCFGERYATICPCSTQPLDEACSAECAPHNTTRATWKTQGTSCLERINYWRALACEEGWVECPPAGLPPMTECTACHQCSNSEAEFDKDNGAHASFTRCGESAQGEGGGATCADVIDSFVSERAEDENGVMRCQGHCGPILKPGCRSFSWGKDRDSGFHTLNWGGCNAEKCGAYCDDNPDECFTVETSPSLSCDDPDDGAEENPKVLACE